MPTCSISTESITDNQIPLIASMQDSRTNSSVVIAAWHWKEVLGIFSRHWNYSAAGESSVPCLLIQDDPRYVDGRKLPRNHRDLLDMKSGGSTNVNDFAPIHIWQRCLRYCAYRYTWNAPIIGSQHEPGIFTMAQQLWFSVVGIWYELEVTLPTSPEMKEKPRKSGIPLLPNEAVWVAEITERSHYIIDLSLKREYIYYGSDDGLVYLRKTEVKTGRMSLQKGLQESLDQCAFRRFSPSDLGRPTYATTRIQVHDYHSAIIRLLIMEKSWIISVSGISLCAFFTRLVVKIPRTKICSTQRNRQGIYISRNAGKKTWEAFSFNFQFTPITDLKVSHWKIWSWRPQERSVLILEWFLKFCTEMEKNGTGAKIIYTPEEIYLGTGPVRSVGSNSEFWWNWSFWRREFLQTGVVSIIHLLKTPQIPQI